MSLVLEHSERRSLGLLASPLFVMALVIAILPLFLVARLTLPIGPMYWDLFIYFDAANRIFNGQVPVLDFFVPVGPLGYYLFAGALKLFPDGQPLLLVSWSMLAVTAPLMGAVLWDMGERARATRWAVLIPFLVFAILPFNTREFFPYPGSDGFGIYNRQVCQLLYVLVAALVFMPDRRPLTLVVAFAMTALFFTKITGFAAGFLICAFAFAAGRIAFQHAFAAAAIFFGTLGLFDLRLDLVSHYVADIFALVQENSQTLLPRFLRAGAYTVGIVAPAGILALVLLWNARGRLARQWRGLRAAPSWKRISALADQEGFWLAAVLFAGVFFETQNTGSQALIFLWPVLLAIIAARMPLKGVPAGRLAIVLALVAAAALPPFVRTVARAARTYASSLVHVPLQHENLKTLGSVNARPEVIALADDLIDVYARHRATYRDLVEDEALPAFMYYLQYDFQLVHLMAIDRAISDIVDLESRKGIHFDTMMELNFVDPFPYLMGRQSPRYVAIGADPSRAVPPPGSQEENAVRDTDLVLYPTCPLTTDNRALYELYKPALEDHFRIRIDACFDAFVHPRFAGKFGKTRSYLR
jgi:hypothetical protein